MAAGSGVPVRFRALRREDAAAFEAAFRAIGWSKPATLFLAYLVDQREGVREVIVAEVGLGVGLHAGYGAAQRLYVRRGYLPDGTGALVDGVPVPEGEAVLLNDDLCLRSTKDLAVPPPGTP